MSGDDKQLELEALAAVGEMLLFDQARGNPEEAARILRCARLFARSEDAAQRLSELCNEAGSDATWRENIVEELQDREDLQAAEAAMEARLSFSEDDCTIQRGLKPVVHTAPDSPISGLLCTKLVYAQYSCAPKRGEHGDRYRTDYRARRGHPARTGMGACASSRGDHWAVGAVGDGRA
jgi:hypothetical protein